MARRDERAQAAVELVRGGMSKAAVAAQLGVSRQAVYNWCDPRPPKKRERRTSHPRPLAAPRPLSERAVRAVEMVRSGRSQSAVARLIGVSAMSVSTWCRAAGLNIGKPRAISSAVKTAAVARVREGMTREMAAHLAGVTKGMVSKWCAAAGLSSPHYTAEVKGRAVEMVASGASYEATAEAVGASPRSVSAWCRAREGLLVARVEKNMNNPAALTAALLSEFPKPYKLVGVETREDRGIAEADKAASGAVHTTNLCGGTCDRCGMAIHDVWRFESANGRVLKLGRDCVGHVLPSVEQPGTTLANIARTVERRKTAAKVTRQWQQIDEMLARGALDALPGPYPGRGETLAEFVQQPRRRTAADAARILRTVKRASK